MHKKEKHCDPTEPTSAKQGDNWDHVALDPEHRLVVSVVPGKRTAENVEVLVEDFKKRTGGRPMNLITTDEYKPYRRGKHQAQSRLHLCPIARRHPPSLWLHVIRYLLTLKVQFWPGG